ncbi:MAG TPA: YqgE/AlgH family protein [Marinagarivorans sp.]
MRNGQLSLRNKFLVALPSMEDKQFDKAVTYICDHGDEGTMGIVINQPLELSLPEIFKQLNLPNPIELPTAKAVLKGGPVKPQRGFLLHTPCDHKWHTSMRVTDELMLTASKDALESIAQGDGPDDYLFALGFAGWSPGQLETELKENCWLTIDADLDTLFSQPAETRWHNLYSKMGVDPGTIASGGNA